MCDYATPLNYQLTDHIKNTHEKVKQEKDAKCDICNKVVNIKKKVLKETIFIVF